jgi:hypothetical protein
MKAAGARAGVPALARVRGQFSAWRRSRTRRSRTPPALWAAAVDLAREHGVYAVAKELRVNYERLKASLESGPARGAVKEDRRFLDLGVAPVGSECSVELESPQGAKVRIHFRGQPSNGADLVALAEALFRA